MRMRGATMSAVSRARNSGLVITRSKRTSGEPALESLRLPAAGIVDRDVDPLAEVLLGVGAVGEAVAGQDEGQHRRRV